HIQTDDTLPPWRDAPICSGDWESERYHLFEYDHWITTATEKHRASSAPTDDAWRIQKAA
ncbi:MAG: hypothetical protein WB611_31895, partial [Stellaceae bacterium]